MTIRFAPDKECRASLSGAFQNGKQAVKNRIGAGAERSVPFMKRDALFSSPLPGDIVRFNLP